MTLEEFAAAAEMDISDWTAKRDDGVVILAGEEGYFEALHLSESEARLWVDIDPETFVLDDDPGFSSASLEELSGRLAQTE